jgi:hypothetical protein
MKEYYVYMKELSANDVRRGFIGFGLFANKIPDFLTSKPFYEYCENNNFVKFEDKPCDYIRYESMRNTNVVRNFAIPNPFAYSNLCNQIADNWDEILKHFNDKTKNQKYKYSQIHIQKFPDKDYIFDMNNKNQYKDYGYDNIEEDDYDEDIIEQKEIIQKIRIKNTYKVDVDISNCFPSIYSHSIPWALVGKKEAKKNKNNDKLWYNKIDIYIRNIKNGETNGLLIGPHSSNLLSEIILSCIDDKLSSKYKYIRNIDDFTCYVPTEQEANKFILNISSNLKDYEMTINTKKTKIIKLPISSNNDWVSALNSFYIGNETNGYKLVFKNKRLRAFIDLAINLVATNNDLAIYTYIIKIISKTYLGKIAKNYYIDTIHYLLLLYPYIVHSIDKYVFNAFNVDNDKIKKIANDLYNEGMNRHIYESCSFSIYWAIKYDFDFDSKLDYANDSIESEDCIFMLLAYLKAKKDRKKNAIKLFIDKAKTINEECDIDKYWLFVYEVLSKDELQEDYKRIKNAKISFIKKEFKTK